MFIVFDGIDGTGKSTQLKMLANWLDSKKIDYFKFREPGGSTNSEIIRRMFIKNKFKPISQLLLVAAARYENMLLLEQNNEKLILSDRFIDSTYAYQGLYLDKEIIKKVMDLTVTVYPDYTFLFLYQYKKRHLNHFDELAVKKYKDLKDRFQERYDPEKYFLIPDNQTIGETHELIVNKIKQLLNLED